MASKEDKAAKAAAKKKAMKEAKLESLKMLIHREGFQKRLKQKTAISRNQMARKEAADKRPEKKKKHEITKIVESLNIDGITDLFRKKKKD